MNDFCSGIWYEDTNFRGLDLIIGLSKLAGGFCVGWFGAEGCPRLTVAGAVAASIALDVIPTVARGEHVNHSLSYRSKTASLLRGIQVAVLISQASRALDAWDACLLKAKVELHTLQSVSLFFSKSVLPHAVGAILTLPSFAYNFRLAIISREPGNGFDDRRCDGCRFLDCEPSWDPCIAPSH